jgi:hypothetical protein
VAMALIKIQLSQNELVGIGQSKSITMKVSQFKLFHSNAPVLQKCTETVDNFCDNLDIRKWRRRRRVHDVRANQYTSQRTLSHCNKLSQPHRDD